LNKTETIKHEIEIPLVKVLADMEKNSIRRSVLEILITRINTLKTLEATIFEIAGENSI
jgi:DNA polymerase-1